MKRKHFYSHLVETSVISLELGDMNLSQDERVELVSLAESQLHHVITDTILSELSEEDKLVFLQHLHSDQHDKIWELLNEKIENIEEKIKKSAEELKKELHKDIREAKEKKE
ncbi:MAG: hypothetical protein HYT83_00860 [Candidatus Levybacteria bacterium]|nr:hypothetical protein [Candidatus Levybacteria bacterium]